MAKYPFLLFDADNTLFDFDTGNRNALRFCCEQNDIPFSDEIFARYEVHNAAVWYDFDRGLASKEFIVVERFRRFLAELGLVRDAEKCNHDHLDSLSRNTLLVPHALEVCETLSKTHEIYLVTNAVASVQNRRLGLSALAPFVRDAFISETAGAAKPSTAYFDYVFDHVDGITKENCIVIGDSLTTDIQGAVNYSIPCCWFNPKRLPAPEGLPIDYEISDLRELFDIV